jgi:hypothetical protein
MIFRASQKLATKLKLPKLRPLPADVNPFADWSAHVFLVGRTSYVILTNTTSLYSVLLPAAGLTTEVRFLEAAYDAVESFMEVDQLGAMHRKFIAPSTDSVQFATALSRSVTGSMNDLILGAKLWLREDDLPPNVIMANLNETPMSSLDYRSPREALRALGSG